MPGENNHNAERHIVPYKTILLVLATLITLTLISVISTRIYLGALTVFVALLIAVIKSTFVLRIFMHLKLESRMFSILTIGVSTLIAFVIIGTLIDYIFR
ncbi:MAG TPA: cytochrome C oxidase subunit IV family protein [Bacteroidales bacterium]|jgi:cytochrome c oxidase subunit 4|nr:cytochrome C oxidase subunit IV family protein [Bacteroidales bacterium]